VLPLFVSRKELAAFGIAVHENTIRRWLCEKRMPPVIKLSSRKYVWKTAEIVSHLGLSEAEAVAAWKQFKAASVK